MVITFGANLEVTFYLFTVEHFPASIALNPLLIGLFHNLKLITLPLPQKGNLGVANLADLLL